jgi:hypothetical protein
MATLPIYYGAHLSVSPRELVPSVERAVISFLSLVGPRSPEFGTNAEAMRAWVAELRLKLEDVAGGGGEASRAGHTSRGKMMPTLLLCPRRRFCQSSTAPDHESGLDIWGPC